VIGQAVSHYRIEERLGEGGMGVVYRAQDIRLQRAVALKFLSEAASRNLGAPDRFLREARAASALNHPNICTLHDVGEHEGRTFLVMELLEGQTLARRLEDGPMPVETLLEVAAQVAAGLEAAHAKGIVHRDIKPANLFLTQDGRAKVLDFGLARQGLPAAADGVTAPTISHHTAAGAVLGTPGYMSPEQIEGRPVDARTDIFALGAVLYEMATGRRAFEADSLAGVFDAIRKEAPPAVRRVNPRVPEALAHVIDRSLEKDPKLRYQHVSDLRAELARVRRDHTAPPASRRNPRRSWSLLGVAAALAALALAAWAFLPRRAAFDSVAVLPFANATGDPGMEYLSDGLTVSLINKLTDLRRLRVKSRSAVFRYKDRAGDPLLAGRELGVRGVVVGTVSRRGEQLVVAAELVETATGDQVWGEQFSRRAADLFALEDDVARGLAERLALRLTPEEARRISRRYTDNSEAYDLYLRGAFHASSFREEGLKRAVEYYRRALAIDPRYALAYTGMAHAYFWFTDWYAPSKEVSPLALDAARRALSIDDRLADAHGLLALVTLIYEWDWPVAEREFRLALELDPADARTRAYFAWLLVVTGRREEAIADARRAQERESYSPEVYSIAGLVLSLARRHEEAVATAGRALDLDPGFTWAHIVAGRAFQALGRFGEALDHLEKAHQLEPRLPEAIASLANAHAASGDLGAARAKLAELEALARQRYVSPFDLAIVYAGLKDKEKTLSGLERAYSERSYLMPSLGALFLFDALRSEPRFKQLLLRMDLPSMGPADSR
jgi:serine/threonine protein kinase/Tfp pilus assembly protein PilF